MNIAVIYGGDSCEKDISIITAVQAMKEIAGEYDIFPVMLGKDGFTMLENAADIKTYTQRKTKGKKVYFCGKTLYRKRKLRDKKIADIDCCLLCTHGGNGENGQLQGYLDVCGLPYTSAGVAASAIGMDKALSKVIFSSIGINTLEGITIFENDENAVEKVEKTIGYPAVVKPCRQGSSIGIAVAKDREQLKEALEVAFMFDEKAVVERALTDFIEINCAVLRTQNGIVVSELEQPLSWEEFLTFEEKYMADGKMSGGGRIYPAKLENGLSDKIKDMAQKAYVALECKGVVRLDFLVDNTDKTPYLNEINTIPGSLATYLFDALGMDYYDVVSDQITYAIQSAKRSKCRDFDSSVLNIYGKSSANACKMHSKIL